MVAFVHIADVCIFPPLETKLQKNSIVQNDKAVKRKSMIPNSGFLLLLQFLIFLFLLWYLWKVFIYFYF